MDFNQVTEALTKADYDRIMERRSRPLTDYHMRGVVVTSAEEMQARAEAESYNVKAEEARRIRRYNTVDLLRGK